MTIKCVFGGHAPREKLKLKNIKDKNALVEK